MRNLLLLCGATVFIGGAAAAAPLAPVGGLPFVPPVAIQADLSTSSHQAKLVLVDDNNRRGDDDHAGNDRDKDHRVADRDHRHHHHHHECDHDDRVSPSRPCREHSVFWDGGGFTRPSSGISG